MSVEKQPERSPTKASRHKGLSQCRTADEFVYYTNILRDKFAGLDIAQSNSRVPRRPTLDELDRLVSCN